MTPRLAGTLFPVAMAALLAGLSFGLQRHVQEPDTGPQGPLPHVPDAIVTQADVMRIDGNGQIKYRLRTPQMVHFVDNETSVLNQPNLQTFRDNTAPTTFTSDTADINSDGSQVVLKGNVLLQRPAYQEAPAMQAKMSRLTVLPDDAKAHTDVPVDLRRGLSWLKGVGMSIDQDQQLFTLHQQARGSFIKSPEQR